MQKILITGGSGFIGTNLINFLSKKNYCILNIDKSSYCSTPENFKENRKTKKYFYYKLDLSNYYFLTKKIKKFKPDTIIHLAAESHVDKSLDGPRKFINNNILATNSLYSAVLELNKKNRKFNPNIIHVSTDEVYGSVKNNKANENYKINPSSPYSASKASSDLIAKSFLKSFNLNISIINLCNNYGPYQFIDKFIPLSIQMLIKNKKVPLYGNGKNIREWMYVGDSCKAILKLITKFKSAKIYNIGSGFRKSNHELAKILSEHFFNRKIKNSVIKVKDRPAHDFRYAINSKKFKKDYSWKPEIKLIEGLNSTIDWYKKNTNWLKNAEKNYNYKRIGN